jgi:hypothetical protein
MPSKTTPFLRVTSLIVATLCLSVLAPMSAAQVGKQSRECTIDDVAVYEDRVVLQCTAKGGKKTPIKYYAIAVTSPLAPMILELGLSSLRRKVKLYFIDDAGLNPPGCLAEDCRKIDGIIAFER